MSISFYFTTIKFARTLRGTGNIIRTTEKSGYKDADIKIEYISFIDFAEKTWMRDIEQINNNNKEMGEIDKECLLLLPGPV